MLKEIIPSMHRVDVLVSPTNESWNAWRRALPDAASKLNIELTVEEARNASEIERAFEQQYWCAQTE